MIILIRQLIGALNMKKVITYGTFDLLHYGHIRLLQRAKEMGDYLIVGLSTDKFNELQKHKESYNNFAERKYILEAIRYVDEVIPEQDWNQKIADIQKYDISLFVMGSDWQGKFDFLKPYCQVTYLSRTPGISTTKIKNDLK
jgi:glycerol-3-phosphate cytidylyltransferase